MIDRLEKEGGIKNKTVFKGEKLNDEKSTINK